MNCVRKTPHIGAAQLDDGGVVALGVSAALYHDERGVCGYKA